MGLSLTESKSLDLTVMSCLVSWENKMLLLTESKSLDLTANKSKDLDSVSDK